MYKSFGMFFSISDSLTLLIIKNIYTCNKAQQLHHLARNIIVSIILGHSVRLTNVVRLRNIDTAVRTTLQDLLTEVSQMLVNSNERVSVFRVSFPAT